jgi:hypothetical protein
MRGRPATDFLSMPVRLHGIELGRTVGVLVGESDVLGFELVCGDGARRFLPLAAAELRDDEIAVSSALVLVDEPELEYYRRRSSVVTG